MHTHETVTVRHNGRKAEIDKGLAELIKLCWENGIDTTMCCENGCPSRGHAWLMLPARSADRLFEVLSRGNPLYQALNGIQGVPGIAGNSLSEGTNDSWFMSSSWESNGVIGIYIHLRFPVSDIPEVVKRLRSAKKVKKYRRRPLDNLAQRS
jgi:hypothetical protein